MKKLLSVFVLMLLSIFIVACEPTGNGEEDGAIAKIAEAKQGLTGLVGDPSNITGNFEVPATLLHGVTVSWDSEEPGVVSFGQPAAGFVVVTVNRPAKGSGDAQVKITATLSLQSELSDDMVTDTWEITLTVKEAEVEEIEINTVADLLALKDPAYDGTYQVTLNDMTIIAKSGTEAWAYDGTGIVQLFPAPSGVEVGKVYSISGTTEWYFGIWEIKDGTAEEDEDAEPQFPEKDVITSIDDFLDDLIEAGEHLYADEDAAAGNFEAIYATITGQVFMIPEDTGNYNTWIVDVDYDLEQAWVPGTVEAPARGLMVYYGTSDFALIKAFAGETVTMDVVIYTYRSNNRGFAIYYIGGPEGISADLSDEDAVEFTLEGLTLETDITEATTLNFITGGVSGTEIEWSFKDAENDANELVDFETGEVTLPEEGQVTVVVVATATKGEVSDTKEFTLKIGELDILTVAAALEVTSGAVRVQATVLGYIANDTIVLYDETGFITTFNNTNDVELYKAVGKKVDLSGTRGAFGGLQQITDYSWTVMTGDAHALPAAFDLASVETWNAASLLPHQGKIIDVADLKVTGITDNTFGNVDLTLTDEPTGRTIRFYWDSRVNVIGDTAFLEGLKVGDYVSFEGALLGWSSNNPLITVYNVSQAKEGEAPVLTDAQKLALDKVALTLAAAATDDLELPLGPLTNGTTVTWESSHPEIIANDGTFNAPDEDTTVTLTATLTNGEETDTKVFEVNAIGAESEGTLIIYEVYGGGGNSGAPYKYDYVVLYNGTSAAIDLSGYSLHYSSANGNFGNTNNVQLSGTIDVEAFYLIKLAAGNGDASDLPVTDLDLSAAPTINLAGANGAIALATGSKDTALTGAEDERIVDLVGFGTANKFEGTGAAPAPSNSTSVKRNSFIDTNDNSADFTAGAIDLSYLMPEA